MKEKQNKFGKTAGIIGIINSALGVVDFALLAGGIFLGIIFAMAFSGGSVSVGEIIKNIITNKDSTLFIIIGIVGILSIICNFVFAIMLITKNKVNEKTGKVSIINEILFLTTNFIMLAIILYITIANAINSSGNGIGITLLYISQIALNGTSFVFAILSLLNKIKRNSKPNSNDNSVPKNETQTQEQ